MRFEDLALDVAAMAAVWALIDSWLTYSSPQLNVNLIMIPALLAQFKQLSKVCSVVGVFSQLPPYLESLGSKWKKGADHRQQFWTSNWFQCRPMIDVTPHCIHFYSQSVVETGKSQDNCIRMYFHCN